MLGPLMLRLRSASDKVSKGLTSTAWESEEKPSMLWTFTRKSDSVQDHIDVWLKVILSVRTQFEIGVVRCRLLWQMSWHGAKPSLSTPFMIRKAILQAPFNLLYDKEDTLINAFAVQKKKGPLQHSRHPLYSLLSHLHSSHCCYPPSLPYADLSIEGRVMKPQAQTYYVGPPTSLSNDVFPKH
ncbi:hypothetical protein BHM03_00041789 [Ensete ventricosum]|nr:hypothetical protein BHM03_00041789 [Ensete ventricosum]